MGNTGPNNLSRRWFVAMSSGALAAPHLASADDKKLEWRNRQSGMHYRRLGRTNLMVSEIAAGGWRITPHNVRWIEMAIERGLNYLDTAPGYGNTVSESSCARLIDTPSKREKVFVATKVTDFDQVRNRRCRQIYEELSQAQKDEIEAEVNKRLQGHVLAKDYAVYYGVWSKNLPSEVAVAYRSDAVEKRFPEMFDRQRLYTDTIITSVEKSLVRLGTDYIDVLHIPHGATSVHELDNDELHNAFYKLKKAGKVRFLGFSCHNDPAGLLYHAAKTGRFDVVQCAYNVVNAHYFDEALRAAKAADVGVLAMKVARAVFTNYENDPSPNIQGIEKLHRDIPGDMKLPMKAYLWVLQNPQITAVVAEMLTEEHVKDDLTLAGMKVKLPTTA
jgi:aryl-alcohol dehydrogenase-like predicted oxidoreductase